VKRSTREKKSLAVVESVIETREVAVELAINVCELPFALQLQGLSECRYVPDGIVNT
jgi:hypothetical protein